MVSRCKSIHWRDLLSEHKNGLVIKCASLLIFCLYPGWLEPGTSFVSLHPRCSFTSDIVAPGGRRGEVVDLVNFPFHHIFFHLCCCLLSHLFCWLLQTWSRTHILPGVYGETADRGQILHRDKPRQSRDVTSGRGHLSGWQCYDLEYTATQHFSCKCFNEIIINNYLSSTVYLLKVP